MLEFRLLGPVEVLDDGEPLAPLPPKQRGLLVALVLRPGQVVSKERLIDDLWGEDPPQTAVPSLENAVSGLRKTLGRELVATRPPGYSVSVDPEQVDVLRFQQLVARARGAAPKERSARLREALGLVRGPPLADGDLGPFAEAEAGRLEELELATREDLLAAELELGRHGEIVPELERLIAAHPYRERLRVLLLLGLYRSGRQADALEAYQEARRTFVDALGTEPGEELRELQRAILRQDPALRARAGAAEGAQVAGGRAARKVVSIVACNLGGWTALAERMDAERVHELLERYASAARAVAGRHGGTIDTLAGDTVTAVFGVPAIHEDDAIRALRVAAELRAEVATIDSGELELAACIGVGTGEVLVDPGGPALVTGAAVGEAQRLARAAAPGEILVAQSTQALAMDAGTLERVRRDQAGPAGTVCYRLVDLTPERAARALRLDAPLVGRERELAALGAALERAVTNRSCELCTVVGVAGVGKSRLVREFLDTVRDRAEVVHGRCVPRGEASAAWPLVEAVSGGETTFLEALGLADRPPTVATFRAVSTFRAVRTALESFARERPLVVAFDDLQWAEPAVLDLVESVLDASRGAPILVLCTARPELLDDRAAWTEASSRSALLSLEPLDEADSERLVDNLLGEADLPDPVIAHIVQSAGGYPLFVEELLAMLVDQAVLRRVGGRWTTGELPTLRIPPTVRALIAARLDRLPPAERIVLELASVQGTRFAGAAIDALAAADTIEDVGTRLKTLVRKDLIRPERGAQGFAFRHELVREAAYDSIPKRARAELHERFAQWLAVNAAEDPGDREEVAGHHLEQAHGLLTQLGEDARDLAQRASTRLGAAARQAAARGEANAAAGLFGRAAALLPREAPERADVLAGLEAALRALEELGDERAAARARHRLRELSSITER